MILNKPSVSKWYMLVTMWLNVFYSVALALLMCFGWLLGCLGISGSLYDILVTIYGSVPLAARFKASFTSVA